MAARRAPGVLKGSASAALSVGQDVMQCSGCLPSELALLCQGIIPQVASDWTSCNGEIFRKNVFAMIAAKPIRVLEKLD
jgi:hypothetical protein